MADVNHPVHHPVHALLAAAACALVLSGCTMAPRYIAGDPVHEAIRKQAWPRCQPANYPSLSRANDEHGVVVLEVSVSTEGKPVGATLLQSSGHPRLDSATLDQVTRCQFGMYSRGIPTLMLAKIRSVRSQSRGRAGMRIALQIIL